MHVYKKVWRAAIYVRLSNQDRDKDESDSITSQKSLIKEHVSKCSDINIVEEMVDDGFSGVNFERPAFTEMMNKIKDGYIDCVIVKDLSRFGRNFMETGKYLEQIFPILGVRFLSINDNYDSNDHNGTTVGIDIPMKNMINAIYSKDISKKIKSAIRTKKEQGVLIKNISIFGYKVEEMQGRRTVIDEQAAEIVRSIFMLANNGLSSFKIAEKLNKDNVITPSAYKKQNGCNLVFKTSHRNLWTVSMVSGIIRDERYTGTFVGCVSESVKLGTTKKKIKPKDTWIRKLDAHPAIISMDLFNAVAEKRKKYKIAISEANKNRLFFKKVVCGYCGHVMRYNKSTLLPRYVCETVRYSDRFGCKKEYINENYIIDVVKDIINEQIMIMVKIGKLFYVEKNNDIKSNHFTKLTISRFNQEIKKLHNAKRKLYESYKNDDISRQTYINERESIEFEIAYKLSEQDMKLTRNQDATYNATSFLEAQNFEGINNDTINKLVEMVCFYGKDRIEIKFSCSDKNISF